MDKKLHIEVEMVSAGSSYFFVVKAPSNVIHNNNDYKRGYQDAVESIVDAVVNIGGYINDIVKEKSKDGQQ